MGVLAEEVSSSVISEKLYRALIFSIIKRFFTTLSSEELY